MPPYPQVLSGVIKGCSDYRANVVGIEEFQLVIWSAADQIVALEERELRRFLQNAESKLELLRFTVDTEHLFERALAIVTEIEQEVLKYESMK